MKSVTIICSIQFDIQDSANAETAKYKVVDLINATLQENALNCQPQILSNESIVVTAIEPIQDLND